MKHSEQTPPTIAPWAVCYTCEQTKLEHDGRSAMACDQFALSGGETGSAQPPSAEHGGSIMALDECAEAERGIPLVGMDASTDPLTHQEIFSAVLHHANEIRRLTGAVPAVFRPSSHEPTHFAFLVKRARDSEAWATIFTDRQRAEEYPGRVSPVVPVRIDVDAGIVRS